MVPLKIVSFIATVFGAVSCGNILFLNGMTSPSHHLWDKVLIRGLAEKGHNITMVSVDDDKNPPPNVHYIYLESAYKTLYSGLSFDLIGLADMSPVQGIISGTYEFCEWCCKGVLSSKGLDIIQNYPDNFKFDLVIHDFTCGPCLLPLIHKFNYPPMVSVSMLGNPPYTRHLTGGQNFPATVPHYITTLPQVMNYPQRLYNTFLYTFDAVYRQMISMPKLEKIIRDRFDFKDYPPVDQLEKKSSLVFVNSDDATDFPEPLPGNVIQVAGLQIVEPKKLPEDLLKFIESGKRGTVLMSLGTNMKSVMLGNERLENILKTFAAIPDYNFIWKFESELSDLPIKPSKNVFISKFLPQNDILAHPHVKAFVTHSGLFGTQEATWYGKPMVGIPFFVDQKRTINKLKNLRIAVEVDFRTLSVEDLKNAILTVLEDPSYAKNAKKVSKIFQDKPEKILDTALWWIEYAMRNPDAPQFDPINLKIGWFAAGSYDVLSTVIIAIYLVAFVIRKIFKSIKNLFSKSDKKKLKRN